MAQEATPPADGQAPPDGKQDPPKPPEGDGTPRTFDEDYVKTLRAEAAKHRKEAADAKARAAELENAQLTETEKLKKEAEDGRKLADAATGKLRNANLRDALAEKGFAGPQAKAVTRLLDSLEYDSDDEPTNLDARLKAAEKDYGDLIKPSDARVDFDGGARDTAPVKKTPEQEHQDFLSKVLAGAQPT